MVQLWWNLSTLLRASWTVGAASWASHPCDSANLSSGIQSLTFASDSSNDRLNRWTEQWLLNSSSIIRCTHTRIYIYIHTHIHIHPCVCVCVCVCVYVYVHVHVHVYASGSFTGPQHCGEVGWGAAITFPYLRTSMMFGAQSTDVAPLGCTQEALMPIGLCWRMEYQIPLTAQLVASPTKSCGRMRSPQWRWECHDKDILAETGQTTLWTKKKACRYPTRFKTQNPVRVSDKYFFEKNKRPFCLQKLTRYCNDRQILS